MSKALIALALVAFVAACAPKPEPAAPVTAEPVYTGKYK
ncbi:hypothetical protein TP2_01200 [Thioclava pacifica DSM 10166]|jgi:hypothetical protein|uniref:Lipoprotein n=1 Tax=Thioclava pacifica DSM 10166 TaxID=1353537 RepID=A0A074JJY8_9RHOB|nr:hypothetical protein TP2_01200 [Thioclava pacifica DSM 10166]